MADRCVHVIRNSIAGSVDSVKRGGGVLFAGKEARRLAVTFPESGLSEAEILDEFIRSAKEAGVHFQR